MRDYGTAKWEGGDAECKHIKGEMRRGINLAQSVHSTRGGAIKCAEVEDICYGNVCGKCGARRIDSQIGLEPSFTDYISTMTTVFREVRRVLRKDGTCWVNMGDSYASAWVCNRRNVVGNSLDDGKRANRPDRLVGGLKEKDLCGIPWRLAFALQDDGWYLRSDIIWSKPNPMPESVTDRPTKAHEYLFLLSKSERYYYDAEAIKEPGEMKPQNRFTNGRGDKDEGFAAHRKAPGMTDCSTRNRRTVWEIATSPFPEAHFATFPPALVEPCILAGCPKSGTVLDPFGGAGTTGLVADRLGRNAILIELNPQYAAIAERRLKDDAGMFADVLSVGAQPGTRHPAMALPRHKSLID